MQIIYKPLSIKILLARSNVNQTSADMVRAKIGQLTSKVQNMQ
jgi:hypothetical protein